MTQQLVASAPAGEQEAAPPRRHDNQALDVLRASAALLVVLEHARGDLLIPLFRTGRDPVNSVLYPATMVGYGAVLVFFVLSGYFVGGSVLAGVANGRFRWGAYAGARLIRLWIVLVPALLFTLAVDEVGRRVLAGSDRFKPGSEAARNNTLVDFVGNLAFVQGQSVQGHSVPGHVVPGHVVPMFGSNGALWSLAFEATYYLAFPLVVAGALLPGSRLRRIVAPVLGVAVLFWVDPHIVELLPVWLLGAAVAWRGEQLRRLADRLPRVALLSLRVGSIALVAVTLQLNSRQGATRTHTVTASYLTGLATALLIVSFLPEIRVRSRAGLAVLRFFSVLAGCSFSLYAAHLPLVSLIGALLHPDGPTAVWRPGVGGWALVVAVTIASVVLGWGFAQLTERHTDAVRRRLSPGRT